ncbi:MAG: hypothetical protein A2Y73_03990 [Chloroflexi bacterium RBG_13_56_8]|nr:MAG: hypothetical protein A2Y73_03990 [Chloroflexi bacterium RBG_13_56_8]
MNASQLATKQAGEGIEELSMGNWPEWIILLMRNLAEEAEKREVDAVDRILSPIWESLTSRIDTGTW